MRRRLSIGLTALLALTAALGCEGAKTATVMGRVTLNGEPLPEGVISFVAEDGKSSRAEAEIVEGEYVVKNVPVATMRVEISCYKVVGERKAYNTPDSPNIPITKQFLPPRFNVKSELHCDVLPGENVFNFEVSEN